MNKTAHDYTQEEFFNCFSRKLMYFLGLHGINYIDKYYQDSRPYWTFKNTEELRNKLVLWDDFKKTI